MKVLIVLAACVVAVSASYSKTNYGPAPLAAVSSGSSSQFRSEDNYGNYNFGYDESHATGGSSRREEQSNGVRRGSYSLSDADGRRRVVNYIADADGFRASIQTNEPGVEPKDSADVSINKAAPVLVAPAPVYAPAPVFAAPAPVLAAPAPVYAPAPVAVKGYARAPVAYATGPVAIEAETPRAFSYSFGSTHLAARAPIALSAPVYAPAPVLAAPAPVYQQRLEY